MVYSCCDLLNIARLQCDTLLEMDTIKAYEEISSECEVFGLYLPQISFFQTKYDLQNRLTIIHLRLFDSDNRMYIQNKCTFKMNVHSK